MRYRYDPELKRCVEIGADWSDTEKRAPMPTEQLVYGGLGKATDGTPIDTRSKHRDYMKATGTTLAGDFTETWKKAADERAKFFKDGGDHRERREDVGRALYQARRRK